MGILLCSVLIIGKGIQIPVSQKSGHEVTEFCRPASVITAVFHRCELMARSHYANIVFVGAIGIGPDCQPWGSGSPGVTQGSGNAY